MASTTIRVGTREDCPVMALIWDVAQAVRRNIPRPTIPSPETLDIAYGRIDNESPWMFVAQNDDRVVGMAFALQARKQDETREIIPGLLHISMVAVLPEFWGHGIASGLVSEIIRKARATYNRAQLWTQLTNTRAHDVYIRLGFTATEERKIDDHGEEIRRYVISLE